VSDDWGGSYALLLVGGRCLSLPVSPGRNGLWAAGRLPGHVHRWTTRSSRQGAQTSVIRRARDRAAPTRRGRRHDEVVLHAVAELRPPERVTGFDSESSSSQVRTPEPTPTDEANSPLCGSPPAHPAPPPPDPAASAAVTASPRVRCP